MKNAKKVLAMVIVLALAISMAIPASAAQNITINGAEDGTIYSAWKMADLDRNGAAYSYTVAKDSPWLEFFAGYTDDGVLTFAGAGTGNGIFTLTPVDDANEYVLKTVGDIQNNSTVMKALAVAAVEFAEDNSIAATDTETVAGNTATFTGLPEGYYCIDSTQGTLVIVDSASTEDDIVITEKNEAPTIEKVVKDSNSSDAFAAINDAEIGDVLEYQITINVKEGATNYVVVDTLTAGLTYNGDIVATSGATTLTVNTTSKAVSNATEYSFEIDGEENVAAGSTIVLTYTATLNENALVDGSNDNTASLKYGEDHETAEKTTKTYTWSFDIFKYTGTNTPLQGAQFTLYRDAELTQPIQFVGANGVYRVATPAEIADGNVTKETVLVNDNNAKYAIDGLDVGTYYLDEVKAPEGYNKLTTKVAVEITSAEDNGQLVKTVKQDNNVVGDAVIDVLNNTGVELPSTGGTGTVIFIAVGSFLVMAMGVLLVVRKRMSKVVYAR